MDTTAPAGLGISINDNAIYTTSTLVTLKLTLTDQDTNGYQMKIWGIDGVDDEGTAQWETFQAEKQITLSDGDGMKTVSVKVRDDVGNESAAVTDDITLNTAVPAVTITGPDVTKVSKVAGFNSSVVSFTVDVEFEEYKVCVVPATNSEQDAGAVIPTTNGSANTSGADGGYPANTPISVTIHGGDLEEASSGDGVKIVKVFARTAAGIWSVA